MRSSLLHGVELRTLCLGHCAVAQTRRVLFAKQLIHETRMSNKIDRRDLVQQNQGVETNRYPVIHS